ncbi:uncharacterized protein TM35_000043600 [Trypanosoma theileri]|uniref:Uncharacterized protein n=1 Tax=Trypanosoma theileri TaxID=67003 RepID=A0A1X0P5C6_9TRYP|nr:uncharacterized protein TM35_000043600 [Trypanosoma theileri]ORC92146.1 hypothetical protein TM35_000043600 [Trypanosoma theileri]
MSSQIPTSMSAEQRANRAAEELASRVAQRSTLSSNAAPFVPSFLQNHGLTTATTTTTTATTELTPEEKSAEDRIIMQQESFVRELQELYDGAGAHTQLPSASSVAATMAVATTALKTFGDMTEEELQMLEEYLWDPAQGGEGEEAAEDRLFVHQDDGMQPDEEEWLIQQMIETDEVASRKKQDAHEKIVESKQNVPHNS